MTDTVAEADAVISVVVEIDREPAMHVNSSCYKRTRKP